MTVLDATVPLLSVLLGSAITYTLNVRSRRRGHVDEVFHAAISAVAVAMASADWIGQVSWGGSTKDEEAELAKRIGRDYTERYLLAIAEARAAVARASAYDPSLADFYRRDSVAFAQRGDELLERLREHLR